MTTTRTSATPSAVRMASVETSTPENAERTTNETEYLLESPKNAARLRKSIASLEAGRVRSVQVSELIDHE